MFATLLLIITACTVVGPGWDVHAQTVMVNVLHNIGQHTPFVFSLDRNAVNKFSCPFPPCNLLLEVGKTRLTKLGALLAKRYPQLLASNTRYTTVMDQMTAQGASAMIFGVRSAGNLSFYTGQNKVTDRVLRSGSFPAFTYRYVYIYKLLDAYVKKLFPDPSVISNMATSFDPSFTCAKLLPAACMQDVAHIALYLYADDRIAKYPQVEKNLDKVLLFLNEFHRIVFGYTKSDPIDAMRGSAGQPLLNAMLSNMNAAVAGTSVAASYVYSGSLTTVISFSATVGLNQFEPYPGQAYALELATQGGGYVVRINNISTGMDPTSGRYSVYSVSFSGTRPDGTTYQGTSIPLPDFARYIASSAPNSPLGICYLTPDEWSATGCDRVGPPATSSCRWYRTQCGSFGCPANTFLADPVRLWCFPLPQPITKSSAGIIAGSFFGALLVAGAIAFTVTKIFA